MTEMNLIDLHRNFFARNMTKKLHVSDKLQNKDVSARCLPYFAVTSQHSLGRCQAFNRITSNFVQTFDHDTRVNNLQRKGWTNEHPETVYLLPFQVQKLSGDLKCSLFDLPLRSEEIACCRWSGSACISNASSSPPGSMCSNCAFRYLYERPVSLMFHTKG